MVLGKLDKHRQTNLSDICLTLLIKFNLKWVEGLNIRPDTIKLLEENVGMKLLNTGLSNDLFFFFFGHNTKSTNKSKNQQMEIDQT